MLRCQIRGDPSEGRDEILEMDRLLLDVVWELDEGSNGDPEPTTWAPR